MNEYEETEFCVEEEEGLSDDMCDVINDHDDWPYHHHHHHNK